MKNSLLTLIFIFTVSALVNAQNIDIQINSADFNTGTKPKIHIETLSDPIRDKFSKETDDKIIIKITNIPANTNYTLNDVSIDATTNSFDVTDDIHDKIIKFKEKRTFIFKLTNPAHPTPTECGFIEITWTKLTAASTRETELKGLQNKKKITDQFRRNSAFTNPYDNKADRIDLFFDENGRLLNFLPVNVDQNDIFFMHVVCVKGDETKYRVNVTDGEYAPVDLAVRPYDKLTEDAFGHALDEEIEIPKEYTFTVLRAGPYTSEYFKFQIAYDSTDANVRSGPEYKIKVNKLFHVGVGVSIVRSGLEAPEYKTYFNGTDTTIEAFNGGNRTLFTFNVIWYWTIFHQKRKGSVIPNGRDVLKDEPSISLTRLFPTLGVTIDEDFKENFFIGGVYEFARGGSFTAGFHYGRVDVLKDKSFEVGKSKFSGADADIKLDKEYKGAFYFGLTVDTRILNLLFSKGQ